MFFYRSTEKPLCIFAVGTALPHNADVGFDRNKEPAGPGLAAYKDDHWSKKGESAYYVKVKWEMMVDPYDGEVLIPRERLIDRASIFKRGPQASGTHLKDKEVARILYEECRKEFSGVWRAHGIAPSKADTASDNVPASARQIDPEERKKIEKAAVAATKTHYRGLGCEVVSREKDNVGWDLDVFRGGKIFCHVEVKGTKCSAVQVELSPNEYEKSKSDNLYRLAVVRNALNGEDVCAVYERNGDEWRRIGGEEGGDDRGAPKRLETEEKKFAIVRQPTP